ncbi:peptide ABC transporter substrate-binding protein [Lacticaseibacillus pabuli]|uniref:Peptide ABC transporter substrate-binding protein n=1 Tax=Lacticaseibacillus pabuli TaxID=3025672 RepID=A0ABY7WQH9_9LACO|nr:peptide ABC transporter substrate-binding protein [Lacticaseibacillus sp. KACC 23028]WDF82437.1 peptide ABC transporter substrate-binding protein [Lacticaseibacillus sp. KACC 23028]
MKKNRMWLGVMSTALVVLLAACGSKGGSADKGQTVTRMEGDVIATMDPALATDVISGQAMTNAYAGLYRFQGKKLTPDMAASMAKVSKDQKTYTFTLRKNAKWSDGSRVTAKDFQYGWQRAVDPATKGQYAYIFSGIENANDIMAGKKKPSTLGAKALSDTKFQVKLDTPMPYFEKMITLQVFDPVKKSAVDKYGDKFGTKSSTLVFNGPYKLNNWNGSDNTWTFTKNNGYWNKKNVKISSIKNQVVKENSTALNLFQDGKLDDVVVSGDAASQMKKNAAYNTVFENSTFYLEMNQNKNKLFRSQKVRQAFSQAINRENFIKKVLGNGSQPVSTVVPAKMFYNDKGQDFATQADKSVKQYRQYDLKNAQKLFAEGMKEEGLTNASFTILTDDTDAAKSTVEYLQNAFSKLATGNLKLNIKTQTVPFKTRLQLSTDHKFDMVVSAWSADFPDAISFLDLFTTGNDYNRGQWTNAEYDKLIKASKTTDVTNKTKRWNDLEQAAQILAKDEGVIAIYQRGSAHLTKTSLKGMTMGPGGMFNFVGATNK